MSLVSHLFCKNPILGPSISKRTNITSIYKQYLSRNCSQNILKMQSSKAWVWQLEDLTIKGGGLQRYYEVENC
jgi:hypothetical protein